MYQNFSFSFIILFLFSSFILQAEEAFHYYDVEQGLVEYKILGGAQLTEETNLTIKGESLLRFKSWGNIRQEEDSGVVITTGAIHSTQEIKRVEKHIDNKVIVVDYDNEQLLEHTKSQSVSSFEKETKGLKPKGEAIVAGVLCKVWVGPSIKKCIYKGIVLQQESYVLGVSYKKEAIRAIFDINGTFSQCTLPQFPKNIFGMINNKVNIKTNDNSDNLCQVFKDVIHTVDAENKSLEPKRNIELKKRKRFINKIAKSIFKKQKEMLQELFLLMKKSRECLHLAEDILMKQSCIKSYRDAKDNLGIQEGDYEIYDDFDISPLESIEDAILNLAPRIPCIKRAKQFTDLSSCMK